MEQGGAAVGRHKFLNNKLIWRSGWCRINGMALLLWGLTGASGGYAIGDSVELERLLELSLNELLEVEVFTPGRQLQSLRDTPGTTIVVTAEQIQRRGYRNLVDLLEMLPGFDVQRMSEVSRINDITMRGQFKHRRFMIMQDGVQIDAPTDNILAISDNYPLYHVKQVEVVYGPNSALWGSDAFGGVINIITRSGEELQGGQLALRRGDNGFRYDQFLAGDSLTDDWSLIAGGHLHATDHAELADSYPQQFAPVDAVTFGGDVMRSADQREPFVTPEESRTLFLRADYQEMLTLGLQYHRIGHSSSNGVRPAYGLYDSEAWLESENTNLYAKLEREISKRLISRTTLDYDLRELLPVSTYFQAYSELQASHNYAKGERRGLDQQFTLEWDKRHTVTFGATWQDYYAIVPPPDTSQRYDPGRPPGEQELYYLNTDLPIEVIDMDYSIVGGYLQLQSRWREDLLTTFGMRYDRHSEYGDSWNPRASLIYHPSQRSTWKLTYGEAFRAPSPSEANVIYGSFVAKEDGQGDSDYVSYWMQIPNNDLGPEKLRSLELSYIRAWQAGSASASAWFSRSKDLIATVDLDPPRQFVEGGEILAAVTPDNLNEADYYGLDLSFDYLFPYDGDWRGELWGSYSYVDGEIRNPTTGGTLEPNYIARHKLRLGLTLSYQDRYFLTPKLRVNSETATNAKDGDDPTKRIKAPGFGVVDLNLTALDLFDVKGLTGRLDLYNLFDRRYYNSGGQGSPVFFEVKPQAPRSWILSLEYWFE
jgi:outer membrane receptor protein involved in Fe transport